MDLQKELKEGFEAIKTAQAAFQKANDERLAKLEKGQSVAHLEEGLARMEKAIEAADAKLEKATAALKRAGTEDVSDEKTKAEVSKKMKSIINDFLRYKSVSSADREFYLKNQPEELKTLSVGSEPDGGYFVRAEMSSQITKKVFESSPMRQLASVVSIGSDAWEEVLDESEVETEGAGETSSHNETDAMAFGMIRIPVHQRQAKPKATLKVLEDSSIDLEAYLTEKVAEKFSRDEATHFISGTGVNQAKGILSYDNGTTLKTIERFESTVSGTFAADDFIDLQNLLFENFQKNASWLMRRATLGSVRKLKDGHGRYLLSTEGNLRDGFVNVILGQPVHFAADMPAIAASAKAVAYGDFKAGYIVVDRLGMSVLRDPYTADNHVLWKFRRRVGGGLRNGQAIKLMTIKA